MKNIIQIIKNLLIITYKFENLIIIILETLLKKINFFYINLSKNKKTFLILFKFLSLFFIFFIISNLPLRFFNTFNYIYYFIVIFIITAILINYFRNKI
jgi:hypothetical protein